MSCDVGEAMEGLENEVWEEFLERIEGREIKGRGVNLGEVISKNMGADMEQEF